MVIKETTVILKKKLADMKPLKLDLFVKFRGLFLVCTVLT